MLDVVRHGFRPPTEQQKTADVAHVAAGGELAVAAMPISHVKQAGIHWTPQGRLFVTSSTVTWKGSRLTNLPDLRFDKGEWIVRITPPTQWSWAAKFVLVSLVSEHDRTVHHEFRIPTPDAELIATVLNSD
jgi:hypothetical protein